MKFTKIRETAFDEIQLNAGVLSAEFMPASGEIGDIIAATSGGISFEATPTYTDFGEDIDNCPKNTKELKKLDSWEVKMSGTFVTVTKDSAKQMVGAADATQERRSTRLRLVMMSQTLTSRISGLSVTIPARTAT